MGHHEIVAAAETSRGSSDRAFGFVFAGFFTVVGAYRFSISAVDSWWWWAIAGAFAVLAVSTPQLLRPHNRLWTAFGLLLHSIVSPVTLALLYVFAILPTALAVRALGKDLHRLSRDPDATTYWINRGETGQTGSMKDQF